MNCVLHMAWRLQLFNAFDINGDGEVDVSEFTAFCSGFGSPVQRGTSGKKGASSQAKQSANSGKQPMSRVVARTPSSCRLFNNGSNAAPRSTQSLRAESTKREIVARRLEMRNAGQAGSSCGGARDTVPCEGGGGTGGLGTRTPFKPFVGRGQGGVRLVCTPKGVAVVRAEPPEAPKTEAQQQQQQQQ